MATTSERASECQRDATSKLERGLERLGQAGNDPDILGSALMSLHGALEDWIRYCLASHPGILPQEQEALLDRQKSQWVQLLDRLERHHLVDQADRQRIAEANRLRQRFAHGDAFEGSRKLVEEYAVFVRRVIEEREFSPPVWGTVAQAGTGRLGAGSDQRAIEQSARQAAEAGAVDTLLSIVQLIRSPGTQQDLLWRAGNEALAAGAFRDVAKIAPLITGGWLSGHNPQQLLEKAAQQAVQAGAVDALLEIAALLKNQPTRQDLLWRAGQAALEAGAFRDVARVAPLIEGGWLTGRYPQDLLKEAGNQAIAERAVDDVLTIVSLISSASTQQDLLWRAGQEAVKAGAFRDVMKVAPLVRGGFFSGYDPQDLLRKAGLLAIEAGATDDLLKIVASISSPSVQQDLLWRSAQEAAKAGAFRDVLKLAPLVERSWLNGRDPQELLRSAGRQAINAGAASYVPKIAELLDNENEREKLLKEAAKRTPYR